MRKYLSLFLLLMAGSSMAQVTINNGEHSMEFSGMVSTFYNYRFLNPDLAKNYQGNNPLNPLDEKKSTFALNNLRFQVEGRVGKNWEYDFMIDFSRLGFTSNIGEFPAINSGKVKYKGIKGLELNLGYQKIPYGRTNLMSFNSELFWQRAEIARGNIYSRRDIGFLVNGQYWNDRINAYAGVFTGQGEQILTSTTGGDGDPSGNLELAARVDVSYPRKLKYNYTVDTKISETPVVSVGAAGRFVNRAKSISGIADYDMKILSGDKWMGEWDVAAVWKGFSALVEYHFMQMSPTGADTVRLQGKPTRFFRAGGLIAQLTYYVKPLRSALSVRYDDFIPNDLIMSNQEKTLSFGYNYYFKDANAQFKIHYFYRMDKDNVNLLRRDDQLRIGLMFSF